jgi:hypothetical protein
MRLVSAFKVEEHLQSAWSEEQARKEEQQRSDLERITDRVRGKRFPLRG